MTKEINLTQGQVAIVDDWNYSYLIDFKWYALWSKKTQSYYAIRYEGILPFRKTILMHREIMNTPKGLLCDHINHDTLDNQEYNLRNVTVSQNQMNKRMTSNNQIGERNIKTNGNSFQVRIQVNSKYVYNKTFPTLEQAIIARDEAIQKYHGEFAYSSDWDTLKKHYEENKK